MPTVAVVPALAKLIPSAPSSSVPPPVMTSVPPPVNSKAPLVRINVAVAGIVSVDVPAAAIVSELMVVVVPAGTESASPP